MLELRLVELSIYYFLKDKLDESNWGSEGYYNNHVVTLMDAYPDDEQLKRIVAEPTNMPDVEIVLPIVSVEMVDQRAMPYELGNDDATVRSFSIAIMGREKAETKDLSQQIYEWFEDNDVSLKNYNQGFPDAVEPNEVGKISIENVTMTPVRIIGSPDISDKHRYEIIFSATTYLSGSSEEELPV